MAISGAFRLFLKVYVAVAVIALPVVLLSRHDLELRIEPNTLYAGAENLGYANKICVVGNGNEARAVRFEVTQGKLPDGLRLRYVRGAQCATFEGTAERSGRFYFTIRAQESGASLFSRQGSVDYTLQVAKALPPPPPPPIID